ncbi:hypothetical protein [Litorivicinus lipolyticus]|nr:hypothetical protein [Litorivicinus lipolyticus]
MKNSSVTIAWFESMSGALAAAFGFGGVVAAPRKQPSLHTQWFV